jgi:hypothetical protein
MTTLGSLGISVRTRFPGAFSRTLAAGEGQTRKEVFSTGSLDNDSDQATIEQSGVFFGFIDTDLRS